MQRTLLQQSFFVIGWTLAVFCCVLTGMSSYMVGYVHGSEDASPRVLPITTSDVLRAISNSFVKEPGAAWHIETPAIAAPTLLPSRSR
jgi:hypothetical protein